ncbi:MAG: DinB family protein [Candidatus Heimdallarchaeota archaeon]|nr:DinB family protein [Candidatus Heimdallarchaeota archaeon]
MNVEQLLKQAIIRHLDETHILLAQLSGLDVKQTPIETGRPLGEIILHMIRSLEFYAHGLFEDHWEALKYDLEVYSTGESIFQLYITVSETVKGLVNHLTPSILTREYLEWNRPATGAEILLEMLEHSIQHRGQIIVYYRLLGLDPVKIPYIL